MPGEFYGIAAERVMPFLQELRERIDEILVSLHSFGVLQGSRAGNWQSGTATSGEAGADLISSGEAGKTKLIHSLIIDIGGLTNGAEIAVKLFMKVNAIERKLYSTTFTVGTDPDGCWVINGTVAIHDVLRVEVQSNDASDNGKPVAYTIAMENM